MRSNSQAATMTASAAGITATGRNSVSLPQRRAKAFPKPNRCCRRQTQSRPPGRQRRKGLRVRFNGPWVCLVTMRGQSLAPLAPRRKSRLQSLRGHSRFLSRAASHRTCCDGWGLLGLEHFTRSRTFEKCWRSHCLHGQKARSLNSSIGIVDGSFGLIAS